MGRMLQALWDVCWGTDAIMVQMFECSECSEKGAEQALGSKAHNAGGRAVTRWLQMQGREDERARGRGNMGAFCLRLPLAYTHGGTRWVLARLIHKYPARFIHARRPPHLRV